MKTILLIEDDKLFREPTAALLRGADWQVLEAGDGESGLALALAHRPEVILCDLMMPRGNGYQLCRAVRQHPEMAGTRIIMLTGRDYPTDRRSAQEAGADDYLVKPLVFSVLEAALARVLKNGSAAAQPEAPGSGSTRLRLWGVRGSIPTPGPGTVFFGGNTSCVEVRADGEIVILDAGTGIRPLGDALAAEFGGAPILVSLLITHTHWDHIQGFPFFLPAYDSKNRVRIFGVQGARARLSSTLEGQMESPYFPIALAQMPGHIEFVEILERQAQIGSIRVEVCQSIHEGLTVGYRLFTAAGSIAYLPDNETFNERSAGIAGKEKEALRHRQLLDFIRGADVLICDAQYDSEEYQRHIGWGHGCVDDVVHFAIAGGVGRLYLFHHDPSHDDRKVSSMLIHARALAREAGSELRIEAAREGEELAIVPRAG